MRKNRRPKTGPLCALALFLLAALPGHALPFQTRFFRCEVKFPEGSLMRITIDQSFSDHSAIALIDRRSGRIQKILSDRISLGTIELKKRNVPKIQGKDLARYYRPDRFPLVVTQTTRAGDSLVGFWVNEEMVSTVRIEKWRTGKPIYIYPGLHMVSLQNRHALARGKCE